MEKHTFVYKNIKFDLRYKTQNEKTGLIIFLHGFKSFRNWGFIPYLCEELANAGFIVLNLDFEFNGVISEHPIKFDTIKFAENKVSKEFENASEIIELINSYLKEKSNLENSSKSDNNFEFENKKNLNDVGNFGISSLSSILERYWNGEINLMGHSRGGGICFLLSQKYKFINKLGLLAPIAFFDRYTPRLKNRWLSDGYLEFTDPISKQILRMNAEYLSDILENADKYNISEICKKMNNPIKIIWGENDISVPKKEIEEILNNLEKNQNFIKNKNLNNIKNNDNYLESNCNFVLLKNANHLFNCSHHFSGTNKYIEAAKVELIEFFKN